MAISTSVPAFFRRPAVRRELIIATTAIAIGLFLMPLLIYAAGRFSLGPYAAGGPGALFRDFYGGLAHGLALWLVVLGPYLFLSFWRLALMLSRRYWRA